MFKIYIKTKFSALALWQSTPLECMLLQDQKWKTKGD